VQLFIFGIKRDIFKITPGNPEIFCGIILLSRICPNPSGDENIHGDIDTEILNKINMDF
jgi:hypothetical protein